MLITDAQIHIWEPDSPERPWPKPHRPAHRPSGFAAEQALAEMDAVGVDRAILVPPSWIGDDNGTALEVAAKHPSRFAVLGRFNFEAPDARARLDGWLTQPRMLGIRSTFHLKPHIDWVGDGSLDWFWEACELLRIPVQVLVPGEVRKLMPIADRHRDLKMIISHMGCPLNSHLPEAFAHLVALLNLARFPNVSVMVSSAPCFSNEPYPFRDLQPFIERIFDVFGPRRMFWGSDITRLTSTYGECLNQFHHDLDFLSEEDKTWILGKALAEVLNWPKVP